MVANKLNLKIITPYRVIFDGAVDELIVPGSEGELGILVDHTEFISALRIGELRYKNDGVVDYVALCGGVMEVKDNIVNILTDDAELGKDINIEKVIERKKAMEEKMNSLRQTELKEFTMMEINLQKEILKIDVAGRYR